MTKVEMWPPPDWEEVVITWTWIMSSHRHDVNELFNLINEQPGGCYHLCTKGDDKDFAFRFENPHDATWFRLMLPE